MLYYRPKGLTPIFLFGIYFWKFICPCFKVILSVLSQCYTSVCGTCCALAAQTSSMPGWNCSNSISSFLTRGTGRTRTLSVREGWTCLFYEKLLLFNHEGKVRIWQSRWQSFQVKACLRTALSVPGSTFQFYNQLKAECTRTLELLWYIRVFFPCLHLGKDWLWYFLFNHLPFQISKAMQHIVCLQIFCNLWN